jgi:hypothetical protein
MLKKRKFLGSNLYCIFVPSLYFALHWYYTISVCFNSILQYDFKKCFRFYSIQLQLSVDEVCHWWNGSQQRIPTQLYHRKINQISTWLMGQCHDIFYLRFFFLRGSLIHGQNLFWVLLRVREDAIFESVFTACGVNDVACTNGLGCI